MNVCMVVCIFSREKGIDEDTKADTARDRDTQTETKRCNGRPNETHTETERQRQT